MVEEILVWRNTGGEGERLSGRFSREKCIQGGRLAGR